MVPVLSMYEGDCFGNMGRFLVQNKVSAVAWNMYLSRYLLTQQEKKQLYCKLTYRYFSDACVE